MSTDPAPAESPCPLLPPPEGELRVGRPLHLATKATIAVLAQVGDVLLTALGPRPAYRAIVEHRRASDEN